MIDSDSEDENNWDNGSTDESSDEEEETQVQEQEQEEEEEETFDEESQNKENIKKLQGKRKAEKVENAFPDLQPHKKNCVEETTPLQTVPPSMIKKKKIAKRLFFPKKKLEESFSNIRIDRDISQGMSAVVEKSVMISPSMIVSSGIVEGQDPSTNSKFEYAALTFTRNTKAGNTFKFSMSLNYTKKLIEGLEYIIQANPAYA